MKFFLAPMQGLTGYTVRNAFHHHFDYIDKYYTPFIPAAKRMNAKDKKRHRPGKQRRNHSHTAGHVYSGRRGHRPAQAACSLRI